MSIEEIILREYTNGKTDSAIAEEVPWSRSKVGRWLRSQGLPPNSRRAVATDATHATCSACGETKTVDQFPRNHKGKTYEGLLSRCRTCRTAQTRAALVGNLDSLLRDRHRRLVIRARKVGVECTITLDEFLAQYRAQSGLCFYTDTPLSADPRGREEMISIDRVDCTGGYTLGNVVFCASRINTMKSDMTKEEMSVWVPSWYERAARFAGW